MTSWALLIAIGFVVALILTVPFWAAAIAAYWEWCDDLVKPKIAAWLRRKRS